MKYFLYDVLVVGGAIISIFLIVFVLAVGFGALGFPTNPWWLLLTVPCAVFVAAVILFGVDRGMQAYLDWRYS